MKDNQHPFQTLDRAPSDMSRSSGRSFDEAYGLLSPRPANPPTKRPAVALMEQGRAFGVGLIVATQNPMDLDYRTLSKCRLLGASGGSKPTPTASPSCTDSRQRKRARQHASGAIGCAVAPLQALQWQVATVTTATTPFNVCIENLRAIVQ